MFAARVIGQFEALLVAPAWLPDMDAWYSGLLPYYLLLPAQIAILMLMAVVAWNRRVRTGRFARANPRAAARAAHACGYLYFVVMAVRLGRQHQRERRGLLARRRDPRGLPLGAGAVPAGERACLRIVLERADSSRAPSIRTMKPTTYPTATYQPCRSHWPTDLASGNRLDTATPADEPNQIIEPPKPTA